mgnify:CR=1 FL=1|tara:strand:+ start:726 stop:1049 length:324 start_codon:yes stop_codon:yes gene_type:complete
MYDIDQQTGIIEKYSKQDGKIVVHQTQDVKPFLDYNKSLMNNGQGGFKGDMHKMATIPPIVQVMWTEELKAMGAPNTNPIAACNRNFLKRKLNSPEWNKLRTKQGVI